MQASDRDKPSAGHVTASCTRTSQPVVRRPSQPLQRGQDEADGRTPAGSQAARTRGHTRVSTHATRHVQYPSPQMHLHKPRRRRFPRGVQASGPGDRVRRSDQEPGPGPRPPLLSNHPFAVMTSVTRVPMPWNNGLWGPGASGHLPSLLSSGVGRLRSGRGEQGSGRSAGPRATIRPLRHPQPGSSMQRGGGHITGPC